MSYCILEMVVDVFVGGVFSVNWADVTFVTVCVVLVVVAQLDVSTQKPSMWSQNVASKNVCLHSRDLHIRFYCESVLPTNITRAIYNFF